MTTRRTFLRCTLGGGGMLLLAACTTTRAPATQPAATTPSAAGPTAPPVLVGTKLAMLHWSSFVPEEDRWFKETLSNEWAKPNGVELSVELVGQNDVQPKVVAAIEAGAGPDIVQLQQSWPHLYAEKLTDVSDVAEPAGPAGGGWYACSQQTAQVHGRWRAVPFGMTGNAFLHRISQLRLASGSDAFPETWEDLGRVGGLVKQTTPLFLGQALGHSYGDPPSFVFPWLWSYGASETDEAGTVSINSDAARRALTSFKTFWDAACDPQCLSWDDSGNNKAYLAGQIWATINGASIYLTALKQAPAIADDTRLALTPKGPEGQYALGATYGFGIPAYVKDPQPAKELLRYLIQPTTYGSFMQAGRGYTNAPYQKGSAELWPAGDPKMETFRNYAAANRWYGYPAAPTAAATESASRYISVDLFARVAQGEPIEATLRWAASEMKNVYGA